MKIAIITAGSLPVPNVRGGGVETLVTKFLEENENGKQDITVFSTDDDAAKQKTKEYKYTKFIFMEYRKQTIFDKLKFKLFNKYSVNSPYSYKQAAKYIEDNNFDRVIIENTTWPIECFSKKFGDRLFIHLHNDWINGDCPKKDQKIFRESINRSGGIVGVSKFIKDRILEIDGIDEGKVSVLYNCTDINKNKTELSIDEKKDIRQKYNINAESEVILYTGRICEEKGVLELVEAFNRFEKRNLTLLIVGSVQSGKTIIDEYTNSVLDKCKESSNQVIFTGYIDYYELYKVYSIAKIQVVPSVWEEPFGLTAIEGLSNGIPVICTNSGGLPEIVDESCGIVIEKDQDVVGNIYNAIKKMLSDDALYQKLRAGAKTQIENETEFENSEYYKRYINIIRGTK